MQWNLEANPCFWFSREEMRRSPISDLCLSIQFIPQEFANLQVSREEFLCMKAIILLNTGKRTGLAQHLLTSFFQLTKTFQSCQ